MTAEAIWYIEDKILKLANHEFDIVCPVCKIGKLNGTLSSFYEYKCSVCGRGFHELKLTDINEVK